VRNTPDQAISNRSAATGDASAGGIRADLRPTTSAATDGGNGEVMVPAALAGDIRLVISLLLAKEGKESLEPLNELAGKLQQLGRDRAAIRAARTALNQAIAGEAPLDPNMGEGSTALSEDEIRQAVETGRALGVDVSVLEGLLAETKGENHMTGEGQVYLHATNPKLGAAFNQERGALEEKILDSYDEALEAKRDATTEINFRIQMAMQHHTSSMATASQIISETKRQDESVRIA
jgi:hypothetical protein